MKLKIAFGGDVCLAELSSDARAASIQTCADLTRGHDLAIANLEFCIVPDGEYGDLPIVAVDESDCASLERMGFDVFCLANNHILDCGGESLLVAKRFLSARSIATVGAGATAKEATAPLILERNGLRIAVINVADATHYAARASQPGLFALSRRRLKRALRSVRRSVDLIVVCVHADLEFTNYPAPWKVALSRWLVKCGSDLVIHHHPHTLQGIEEFQGGLIAYSLGNLVFPIHGGDYLQGRDGHVNEGALLSVTIDLAADSPRRITYSVRAIVIRHDNVTRVADASEAAQISARMTTYASHLGNASLLRRLHFRRCQIEAKHMLFGAYYALKKEGLAECVRFLGIHVRTQMHRNWMRGLITFGSL